MEGRLDVKGSARDLSPSADAMAEPPSVRQPARGGVFVSEDVLFWAFRYALGRQTYAVGDVAKGIVASVGSMTAGTTRRIRQEIEDADRDGALGSACDEREWKWVHHKLAEAVLADGALEAPRPDASQVPGIIDK